MAAVNATGSGNWSDPTKWSSNPSLPGAGDDVNLGAYNITLNQDATVLSLTWTTGTLTVSGNRTLTTAVTIPYNTGYVTTPVGNTLNFVGNMTYTSTSGTVNNSVNGGAFRVAGTMNHTGNVVSRVFGIMVTIATGGAYNLTGDITTTGTVYAGTNVGWIYGAVGSSMTMVGNFYIGWTLSYSTTVVDLSGTFTFTGSVTIGQNTLTDYYGTALVTMRAGGVANITLNGLTLLTNINGSDGSVFAATGVGTAMTINAVPVTIDKANFRLLITSSNATASYTGNVTISATMSQVMFYAQSSSQLTYSGTLSITGAYSSYCFRSESSANITAGGVFSIAPPSGSCYLFYTSGGSLTATSASNITANPASGNSFVAFSASGTLTLNANVVCSGSQSGGNGNQTITATGSSAAIINMTGNITQNGVWSRTVYAYNSGVITITGNITIGSTGQSYAVDVESSGVVTTTGTIDLGGTAGNNIGIYAATGGTATHNGLIKRTGIASSANSTNAYNLIWQAGTGVIIVNGSMEVLADAGNNRWFFAADLTKVTWNPGVSGHFTYLNWSFGGNDYPATNKVLSPTSFGFGAFTGTATDVSGQMTAALTAQGLTPTRAAKLDLVGGTFAG